LVKVEAKGSKTGSASVEAAKPPASNDDSDSSASAPATDPASP
jgi:hypothetical protein